MAVSKIHAKELPGGWRVSITRKMTPKVRLNCRTMAARPIRLAGSESDKYISVRIQTLGSVARGSGKNL